MKMRTEKRNENKKFWSRAMLIVFLMGLVGAILGVIVLGVPMNENEFQQCVDIGQKVYDQIGNGMIEVPNGYAFEQNATQISIRKEHRLGSATAMLQNDKLVFEHEDGKAIMLIVTIIMSLVFMIITWFIISGIAKALEGK